MGCLRLGAVLVLLCLGTALPLSAELRAYRLDPVGSQVEFTYWVNGQPARGSMPVRSADLSIDLAALHRSRAEVVLDATGTRTNALFVTQALKGDSVLAVARFPTIRFRSRSVQGTVQEGARILGDVTIRGVTRPIVLQARLFRPPGNASGAQNRLSVHLTGQISRAAFGATGYPDLVGDRVDLQVTARLRATE